MIRALRKMDPGVTSKDPCWEWTCQKCGDRGLSTSYNKASNARKAHYMRHHAKKPIDRKYIAGSVSGKCGETCVMWNGKKICMRGNVSREGTILSCWRNEDDQRD